MLTYLCLRSLHTGQVAWLLSAHPRDMPTLVGMLKEPTDSSFVESLIQSMACVDCSAGEQVDEEKINHWIEAFLGDDGIPDDTIT